MKVLIVGAGVAGLAIGWRLRLEGADVTILERGPAARGATWASAGMLAVAGEMSGEDTPEAEFGCYASALWPGFATQIEAASGMPVFYRACGSLLVATTQAEADAFSPSPDSTRLDAAETRRMEPMLAPDIAGGLWAPGDAQVDNRALGSALAKAFVVAGGRLSVNEAAIEFVTADSRVLAVNTTFASHEADAFVIAAGAWSGQFGGLAPEHLPPVRPVKGEMIAVAPPPGARLPARLVWGNGVYLVPRPDRLLIGATVEEVGFDTAVTPKGAEWLSRRAIALMPGLSGWGIVEHWAGLRPGSPDDLPILGASSIGNLFIASGQYRNGILFAPAIAESISGLVLGRAAPIPAFDPRRFHERPSIV